MIAGAYDLVPERLLSKPIIERPDILQIISGVHKVAGMNQNISLGSSSTPKWSAWVSEITTIRID
jgi:hypothetical protein